MRFTSHLRTALLTLSLGCATITHAATPEQLLPYQQRWAEIQYTLDEKARAEAFGDLAVQLSEQQAAQPLDPDLMIWQGIVLSSQAGAKGGLGALKLVKQARTLFEAAIEQDASALSGSALTSLATLYHQVPGWPLGFGNDDKARELFEQALAINPNGIDTNYFYAAFLLDTGDNTRAEALLHKALTAPPRPGRQQADAGRHKEIQVLLQQLK